MAHILLADDDRDLCALLATHLEAEGHKITQTGNGAEAVKIADVEKPDLVILDMNMPGLTGWDAVRQIRKNTEATAIPVIALSAHRTAGDKDEAHNAGCDIYLEKPVEIDRLIDVVKSLLG